MRPKSKLLLSCIALSHLYGQAYGNVLNETWISTSNTDLLTATNWTGPAVPSGIAFFDSTIPNVVASPTANSKFVLQGLDFLNSASYFNFTFTGPGALKLIGPGIIGVNTNTTINATNSGGPLTYPQVYFAPAGGVGSLGNAKFNLTNSGSISPTSSGNIAQMVLADGSPLLNPNIHMTARDNTSITVSNSGTVSTTNGDVAQILLNTAIFNAGNFFVASATNSYDINTTSGNAGQIVIDGLNGTTTFTTGDNASFRLNNNTSVGSSGITALYDSGQILIEGANVATLSVGNNVNFDFENSSILSSNQDAGQLVLHANTNEGVASFLAESNAKLTFNNSGNINANFSGQIILDGSSNNAFLVLGNNGIVNLNNKGTISGSLAGQLVVDCSTYAASFTLGDNCQLNATNSGTTPYQVAFNGNNLNTGNNVALTALNTGTVESQFYFINTSIVGAPTLTAINQGTLTGAGIDFEGACSATGTKIVLENSSMLVNTTGVLGIGSLTGDSNSTVQLYNGLDIVTPPGSNTTFAGVISSSTLIPYGLTISGSGVQVLSGANTYTGNTNLISGTLVINGSVTSEVLVYGGLLAGTGSITKSGLSLGIYPTGTVQPGPLGGIGTLTVNGSVTNQGNLIVNFNSSQASLLEVNGLTTLQGGEVIANPLALPPSSNPYLILHSTGALNGTYNGVMNSVPIFYTPSLVYDYVGNNVYLQYTPFKFPTGNNCIQKNVVSTIQSVLFPSNDLYNIATNLIALDNDSALKALSRMGGEQYTLLIPTADIIGQQFLRRLYDPIRSLVIVGPCYIDECAPPSWDAWLEAGGGQIFLNGTRNAHGLTSNNYQITGGLQGTFADAWTLGGAVSYTQNFTNYRVGGRNNHYTTFGALYGLYRDCNFYILADGAVGYSQGKLHRPLDIGTLHYRGEGCTRLYEGLGYGEAGIDMHFFDMSTLIQPFVGVEVGYYSLNRIHERDLSPLTLDLRSKQQTNVRTRLGLHMTETFCCSTLVSLDVAWNYLCTRMYNNYDAQFAHFGDSFVTCGPKFDRNEVDVALTVAGCLCDCWEVYAEGTGQFWSRAQAYTAQAGLKYSF